MAILERGNENWTTLAALVERVGTANVLFAIAAINRDELPNRPHAYKDDYQKLSDIVECAANKAGRCDPKR